MHRQVKSMGIRLGHDPIFLSPRILKCGSCIINENHFMLTGEWNLGNGVVGGCNIVKGCIFSFLPAKEKISLFLLEILCYFWKYLGEFRVNKVNYCCTWIRVWKTVLYVLNYKSHIRKLMNRKLVYKRVSATYLLDILFYSIRK